MNDRVQLYEWTVANRFGQETSGVTAGDMVAQMNRDAPGRGPWTFVSKVAHEHKWETFVEPGRIGISRCTNCGATKPEPPGCIHEWRSYAQEGPMSGIAFCVRCGARQCDVQAFNGLRSGNEELRREITNPAAVNCKHDWKLHVVHGAGFAVEVCNACRMRRPAVSDEPLLDSEANIALNPGAAALADLESKVSLDPGRPDLAPHGFTMVGMGAGDPPKSPFSVELESERLAVVKSFIVMRPSGEGGSTTYENEDDAAEEMELLQEGYNYGVESQIKEIASLRSEVQKLRAWRANGCTHPQEMVRAAMESGTVHNVTARVVTCVFCGHEYPDGTPTSQNDKLTEHIRACEKHPMREVERQFRLATDALVRLSTLGGGNSEGNNIAKDALSNLSRNAINSNTHLNDLGMNQIREVFGMRAESHGLDVATVVSARVCKLERLLSEAIQCLTADDHGGTHAAGRMCPRCELVRNAKALLTLSGRPDVRPNSDWQGRAIDAVIAERRRQDRKWGEQNHGPDRWSLILTEETGEVAKAALENGFQAYCDELVQVAAVALAALECAARGVAKP